MSRRFWIGTPKGQNTTADTFFNTSNQTIYQVLTSAPTTYPSFFDTFYDTNVPTGYVIATTYPVNTLRPTIVPYPVSTSHPTADTRITQYYDPGTITSYLVPTSVTRPTYIGYTAPTTFAVTVPVYRDTSFSFVTNFITQVPSYVDTQYGPVSTTYPGFTTPTTYGSPTSATFPSSDTGCYFYNPDGSPAGQDSVPAGCSVISCSPPSYSYATGSAPTYFQTCRSTPGVTTFLTHVYVAGNTSSTVIINGQTDPDNGVNDCYPDNDPGVIAYCQDVGSRCEPCQIFVTTTYETDVGYDTYTSAPATITTCFDTSALTTVEYLASQCQDCSLSCTTNYISYYNVPTYYPPYSTPTSWFVSTLYGYVPTPASRNTTTVYATYVRDTTYNTTQDTIKVTSPPTTYLTTTQYQNVTGDFYYDVPTEYTRVTTYDTLYETTVDTTVETLYPTNVATTIDTATPTSNQTSVDTTVITSWLTDNEVTTTYQTSRSTTWFTQ